MDSKHLKNLPDQLWFERKPELNNIVRKNMVGYSFLNSFFVLTFLGFNYEKLGIKFPTTAFWGFVVGNFIVGMIARCFVLSKGHKGTKSRKNQYLVMMAWQNLAMIIILFWNLGFAITGWLFDETIQLSIYWLVALLILSNLIYLWWIPRKKIFNKNSESDNRSENKNPSNYKYLWIIGLLILLSRTISRMVIPDVKSFLLIIITLTVGIALNYFVMYTNYRDYLLWKNGYLD